MTQETVLYSQHAKREMESEEFGVIVDSEVYEAVLHGEIIQVYEGESPYPCVLVYGQTSMGRPLHLVCAVGEEDGVVIVVTVYQPDPARWIDFKRRRR